MQHCCHFTSSLILTAFRKLCRRLAGMSNSTACQIICPTIPMMEAFQVVRIPATWTFKCFSSSLYRCVNNCSVDFPRDCGEVFSSGEKTSGLYPIKPNGSEPFLVYCEFTEGKYTHETHAGFSTPILTLNSEIFLNLIGVG